MTACLITCHFSQTAPVGIVTDTEAEKRLVHHIIKVAKHKTCLSGSDHTKPGKTCGGDEKKRQNGGRPFSSIEKEMRVTRQDT